ncbi:MAG TPA: primosomal protein N' [Candidatus Limnocylindrales bacterium]|nr:primosomal protein N' [Candidatus Limnocylindrales bacterium]
MTLGLDSGPPADPSSPEVGTERSAHLVEVAVDAAGAGGARPYTYQVPERLADLEPGEAVLVAFGRRQALGIVLAAADAAPDSVIGGGPDIKPVIDRVRADGALLPGLQLALARWISAHYLAPPALVIRSMLPPGLLERLELVAERTPHGDRVALADPVDADLLAQLEGGPRPARDLAAPDGRAGLLRRLHALEAGGAITLDWTLLGASGGPRYERWLRLTEAGRVAADAIAAGERPPGRALGTRQVAILAELALAGDDGAGSAQIGPHAASSVASVVQRGLVETEARERPRRPLGARPPGPRGGRPPTAALTPDQGAAVERATRAVRDRDPRPLLLHGVTGAGKTAIYVEALAASLELGRPGLVLVPEIALALPLVDRLRADLDARVALVHSGLGDGERADEWRRIRADDVDIVVGTRLAVVAPLGDIGIVIVDEEHDPAYKSDRTPRIQARDVAIRLGELAGAAVVLGSATPAVESLGRAMDGTYDRVSLPTRPSGSAPLVEVVDLRAELADGNRGLLSRPLDAALDALDTSAGDQAILVLNRRGSASVVLCRDCGYVQVCPDCERPLVYHQAGTTLRCHHCGRASPLATRCPHCGSPRIRYLGGGTERVEREVRSAHAALRVARLDRDVAARRGAAERVVDAFTEGRVDVLVGTSLVTKGLDVPSVTLVGVVSSDVALNLPDERAAERTFQLLSQAVGRAGRGERPGRAILQTYQPDHPVIQAVATDDADAFYRNELAARRRFGSPPYGALIKLTVALPDRDAAEAEGRAMADRLRARAAAHGVAVMGPAPAYIARRNDRWRFHLVLRGDDPLAVLGPDPGPPWSVDVDPESLL